MNDTALAAALSRVEQALGRIEAVAAQPVPPAANSGGDSDLKAKHEALKTETRAVIDELDTLIAKTRAGESL
jgi:hypothetical protein